MDIEFLKEIVFEFREALEKVVYKRLYGRLIIFGSFPSGCCRYTSDLLAEYIMQHGIPMEDIQMIEGESHKKGYTHCWLLIDNFLTVDITADQFSGINYFKKYEPISRCYVAPCDMPSVHECFNNFKMQKIYEVGIETYGGDISNKLKDVYNAVLEQIDANSQRRLDYMRRYYNGLL